MDKSNPADSTGEQLTVLALHTLHEDGLALVQVVNLLLGQFDASQRLPVEELVVLEDEFHAPALGVEDLEFNRPAGMLYDGENPYAKY